MLAVHCWAWGLPRDSAGDSVSLVRGFSTRNSFWLRDEGFVYLFSQHWGPFWLRPVQTLYMLPWSLGFICVLVLLCPVALVSSVPTGPCRLSSSSFTELPEQALRGKVWWGHHRISDEKLHVRCCWQWGPIDHSLLLFLLFILHKLMVRPYWRYHLCDS